jgi:hypothetical protein
MARLALTPDGFGGIHKVKFTQDEDLKLAELVATHGEADWPSISRQMGNRTVRQCRERWCNYLAPSVCTAAWTPEEDALLLEKFREFGSRWRSMTQFFPGRTDINLKNHYMTLTRHRCGQSARGSRRDSPPEMSEPAEPVQPEPPEPVQPAPPVTDFPAERPAFEWGWCTETSLSWVSGPEQKNMDRDFYFASGFF